MVSQWAGGCIGLRASAGPSNGLSVSGSRGGRDFGGGLRLAVAVLGGIWLILFVELLDEGLEGGGELCDTKFFPILAHNPNMLFFEGDADLFCHLDCPVICPIRSNL